MKKRVLSLLLVVMTLFAVPCAYAESNLGTAVPTIGVVSANLYDNEGLTIHVVDPEDPETRTNNFIDHVTLHIGSPVKSRIDLSILVVANEQMQKLGYTTCVIQHWENNQWVTVYTYSPEYMDDTTMFASTKSRAGFVSGTYYRFYIQAYARKAILQTQVQYYYSSSILCR